MVKIFGVILAIMSCIAHADFFDGGYGDKLPDEPIKSQLSQKYNINSIWGWTVGHLDNTENDYYAVLSTEKRVKTIMLK